MESKWFVDGLRLEDRTRTGGRAAISGFNFQAHYAVLQLTKLLTCSGGLVEVRYEGAQDIDVRLADGRQIYIQAKRYSDGVLSLNDFYNAMASFTRDILAARKDLDGRQPALSFELICAGVPNHEAIMECFRGVFQDKHACAIASRVASRHREDFTDADVLDSAKYVLVNTKYRLTLSDDPESELAAIFSMELIRFGVHPPDLQENIDRIFGMLRETGTYEIQDVASRLVNLPLCHPASERSSFRLLPGFGMLKPIKEVKASFLVGGALRWDAVGHGLDIERRETFDIQSKLERLRDDGGVLVVVAAAGSGKTVLARRVAWDAQRSGRFLVLDLRQPSELSSDNWDEIERLASICHLPLLLFVDDVGRHPTFITEFGDRRLKKVVLLATSRPGYSRQFRSFSVPVQETRLLTLTEGELHSLKTLLGRSASVPAKAYDDLLATGQILALLLVLQAGSLEEFASSILDSIRELNEDLVSAYLDLCAFGIDDRTVLEALLIRKYQSYSSLDSRPEMNRLVFREGLDNDRLRPGHALIAEAVVRQAEFDPTRRMLNFVEVCDVKEGSERRFALRTLQNASNTQAGSIVVDGLRNLFIKEAQRIAEVGDYADLKRLSKLLRKISANKIADDIEKKATPETIRSGQDAVFFLSTNRDLAVALPPVLLFYQKSGAHFGRRSLIRRLTNEGSVGQRIEVCDLAIEWLRQTNFPFTETKMIFELINNTGRALPKLYADLFQEVTANKGADLDIIRVAAQTVRLSESQKAMTLLLQTFKSVATPEIILNRKQVVTEIARVAQSSTNLTLRAYIFDLFIAALSQTDNLSIQRSLIYYAYKAAPSDRLQELVEIRENFVLRGHEQLARGLIKIDGPIVVDPLS